MSEQRVSEERLRRIEAGVYSVPRGPDAHLVPDLAHDLRSARARVAALEGEKQETILSARAAVEDAELHERAAKRERDTARTAALVYARERDEARGEAGRLFAQVGDLEKALLEEREENSGLKAERDRLREEVERLRGEAPAWVQLGRIERAERCAACKRVHVLFDNGMCPPPEVLRER